jgi:hypothetical protein
VLVIVGMHARLIYSTVSATVSDHALRAPQKASQWTPPKAPQKTPQKPHQSDAEYPDLVLQLQAAKRAHGMV